MEYVNNLIKVARNIKGNIITRIVLSSSVARKVHKDYISTYCTALESCPKGRPIRITVEIPQTDGKLVVCGNIGIVERRRRKLCELIMVTHTQKWVGDGQWN